MPDAVLSLSFSVAVPVSADKKRAPLRRGLLDKEKSNRGHDCESGFIFPCPSRAEGQPHLRSLLQRERRTLRWGNRRRGSCVKDTPVCNLFYTLHCTYFPFVNILVLLADLLHSSVRFG